MFEERSMVIVHRCPLGYQLLFGRGAIKGAVFIESHRFFVSLEGFLLSKDLDGILEERRAGLDSNVLNRYIW